MQEVEKTLRELYKYYHSLPKRLSQLKEVAAALEIQLQKLKDINAVRWVASKEQARQAFLKSWQAVLFQLQKNSNVGTSDTQKAEIYIYFFVYFISIFILLTRRKATGALIHRVDNYPDLLPQMPRYCYALVIQLRCG